MNHVQQTAGPEGKSDQIWGQNECTNQLLGQNIRYCRKMRGLTIEELALAAGMGYAHLGRIERGLSNPTIQTVARLASVLRVTPAMLLEATLPDVPPCSDPFSLGPVFGG